MHLRADGKEVAKWKVRAAPVEQGVEGQEGGLLAWGGWALDSKGHRQVPARYTGDQVGHDLHLCRAAVSWSSWR